MVANLMAHAPDLLACGIARRWAWRHLSPDLTCHHCLAAQAAWLQALLPPPTLTGSLALTAPRPIIPTAAAPTTAR